MGKFGIYRWALAICVVFTHLASHKPGACGFYAVFGFFVLSGYLMTLVLEEHYLRVQGGVRRYLANRALRIYPLYWLAALMALSLVLLAPQTSASVQERMLLPHGWQWFGNFFILGLVYPHGLRIAAILIPPTWSLSTEIVFYLFLPQAIRQRYLYNCWVVFSVLLWISFVIDKQNLWTRYFSLLGGSMPFAVGSALYYLRDKLPRIPNPLGVALIVADVVCHVFYERIFPSPMEEGFYTAFLLNVPVIYYLSRLQSFGCAWLDRLDDFLSDLAYPIFLLHVPIAVLVKLALGPLIEVKTLAFFYVSLPFIHVGAYALYRVVESRLAVVRARVRG